MKRVLELCLIAVILAVYGILYLGVMLAGCVRLIYLACFEMRYNRQCRKARGRGWCGHI